LAEPTILASIIVLGGLIAADAKAPTALGVVLIGVFGLAHGYAHGAEAPADAGLGFPIGFAIATATLHGLGLCAGLALRTLGRPALIRLLGAAAALGGVALAFGA
jgi:urease accessory protein